MWLHRRKAPEAWSRGSSGETSGPTVRITALGSYNIPRRRLLHRRGYELVHDCVRAQCAYLQLCAYMHNTRHSSDFKSWMNPYSRNPNPTNNLEFRSTATVAVVEQQAKTNHLTSAEEKGMKSILPPASYTTAQSCGPAAIPHCNPV